MSDRTKILLVEDEAPMRKFLRASLQSHDFEVFESASLGEAMREFTTRSLDVVLLDLGLPDGDGLSFLREIRQWSQVPIVVVSARGVESDKVEALDLGADDYLTKPFGVNELLARLRVVLRRVNSMAAPLEKALKVHELEIDLEKRRVRCRGEEVHLTPIEYRLLVFLARAPGKVLTHRQILTEVWGKAYANQNHYVRVHLAELRKKIEKEPARPEYIFTEPGVGYRFRDLG